MTSQSFPLTAASFDRTRRCLVGIIVVTALLWALVIADLAAGGRPDPPALRAASTLLEGPWRFHPGDDPRWAKADTDDSAWATINLTAPPGSHDGDVGLPDYVAGWSAHGFAGLSGYAWYRRAVTVPAGSATWDILGPTLVEDGYELYWNGKLLGGSGRLGPDPHLVGTRPMKFALPADATGTRGVLAVRAFMRQRSEPGADEGGMHSAPILAPQPVSEALHNVQWQRTIAGYIVDAVEPLAMLAVIGLVLACRSRSTRKGFLVFAGIAFALTAARRANNAITAWTDLQDLATYALLAKVMWIPTFAAWVMAWNRWLANPWRSIDVFAVVFALGAIVGVVLHSPSVTTGSRLGLLALFVLIGARIARSGPLRIFALITLAAWMATMFGGELLDPLGLPGIWFPFGIGVSRAQYLYALAIPLIAILIVQTLREAPERTSAPPAG